MKPIPSIFTCSSYRDFFDYKLKESEGERGYKAKLSEAANCKQSYLSRVLGGDAELTLEQAAGLTQFWNLDPVESQFFVGLVELQRAGTRHLQKMVRMRLGELRDRVSKKVEFKGAVLDENLTSARYFESWYMMAIHVLLEIPTFRTPAAIAQRLELSQALVEKSLETLRELGIAELIGNEWQVMESFKSVVSGRAFSRLHLTNWRLKAADNLSKGGSYHYSGIMAISKEQQQEFTKRVGALVAELGALEDRSKPEELVCLNLDWFKV